MAGDHRRDWRRNSDRSAPNHSADSSIRSGRRGPNADGFSVFALYYVYVLHGEPLECGCFGNIIGSQLGLKTALRNLLLLIPALIVLFSPRK